jgi:hypothetical protein
MSRTADSQTWRVEDLPEVLASERTDPMSETHDWFVWQESIGREDPAPSYIDVTLSTGRVLRVCQEDLIDQIEAGNIEAEPVLGGTFVDLTRKFTAADRRLLQA